jgi:hypothetical protein
MTTLQVALKLVLIRDDNNGILVIATELMSFGGIRQGVMHRRWVVIVILFHPGSLVREAHDGKNVTRTGEDRATLRPGSRRSEYVQSRKRLERRTAMKERRARWRARVKEARCAQDAVINTSVRDKG